MARTTSAADASITAEPPPIKEVIVIGAGELCVMGHAWYILFCCVYACGLGQPGSRRLPFMSAHSTIVNRLATAGIGGLCVANALQQKGLKVTVVERSKELNRQRSV